MLTILKMAWRNIFRYRSRTTITLVSIVVSVFIAILVDAFLMGVFTQSEVNMLSYECSEVVVYADGYLEKKELFPADIVIESDTRNQMESAFRKEGIRWVPPQWCSLPMRRGMVIRSLRLQTDLTKVRRS